MSLLSVAFEGDLAILTLSNPPLNTFSQQFGDQLRAAIGEVMKSGARAMLTVAEGPHFCAGADVKIFVGRDLRSGGGLVADALNLIDMIEVLPIPTVVAVNGLCVAAGMEIMLAHDIVFAASDAEIGQTEALIGTSTLAGGAQRIAARAGIARAKEMVFEGRRYDANTLEQWNIVNKVVAPELLRKEAFEYANKLANGPTVAHSVTKSIINAYSKPGLAAADNTLRTSSPKLFETKDKQACVKSFLTHGSKAFINGDISYEGK